MDHDAEFEEFFDSVFERAKALARRLRLDSHEAEDVAMEALTRAYVRWRKLQDVTWREAWVIKVTANLSIDALRRAARVGTKTEESAAFEDAAVARLDVSRALSAIPRRQCEVVVMRYLADLPETEVASALHIRQGTVKSHAHRGQEALAALLKGEPNHA